MEYTISKGAPGKRQVSFSCPACQDRLKTPLESAGQEVNCPTCGHLLLIPGVNELAQQQAELATTEQAAERLRQQSPTATTVSAPIPGQSTAGNTAAASAFPVRAPSPLGFAAPRPAVTVAQTPAASPASTPVAIPQYRGLLTAKSVFWVLAMLCYLAAAVGFVAGACLIIYGYSTPKPVIGAHGDLTRDIMAGNIVMLVGGTVGLLFYGFVLQVVGELISAFRDIAMNSFKR